MNLRSRTFKTNVKIEKGALDMTPLIDVVFQLIIFFLLSSSFVLQPGLKVDLPEVKMPVGEKTSELSISILRDGRLFWKDREVKRDELPDIFKSERARFDLQPLIIKADQKVRHGTVVQIMAIARENGVSKLAIATKPAISDQRTADSSE